MAKKNKRANTAEKLAEVLNTGFEGQEAARVPFHRIVRDDDFNSRKTYENIDELSQDIAEVGLLSPLILRPREDGDFDLVAGFRRHMAVEKLGWIDVPAIIQPLTDLKAGVVNLRENLSRDQVTPWELGKACLKLAKAHGLSAGDLQQMLNYSRQQIAYCIKLQQALPDEIKDDIESGKVKDVPQSVLRKLVYNCNDEDTKLPDREKQLEVWKGYTGGSKPADGEEGEEAQPVAKRPTAKAITAKLEDAVTWSKVEQSKYSDDFLKGVRVALKWAATGAKSPVAAPPALADDED